ncbi:Band 7 protein family and Stomatin family-containing protein [Aphelenchoides besseyi]|nr:Band 7 protein family and Stomatin family-containing protein [Aphelenchoides besseyi]
MKRRTQTITSDNTPTESFEEPLVTSQRSPATHSAHAHFFDYGLGTPPPPSNVFLAPPMEAGHLRPPTDTLEKIPIRARSQSWLIRTRHLLDEDKNHRTPIISHCLYILSIITLFLTLPFCLPFCIKITKEYERGVVFRLGRLLKSGTKGPGIFFVIPCLDVVKIVDLRVLSFDVPSQEILSRGTKTLSEILMERDSIASITEKVLDDGTVPWGVKVQRVEIKDIRLPHMLMRSMAAEAEAARDARARVIAADGEEKASRALVEAADVIKENKVSLHLRYLQTMSHISNERNKTIVIPIPIEVIRTVLRKIKNYTAKTF